MIALLDRLDGDPDCEDEGDSEPSLACPNRRDYQAGMIRFPAD
jgi:hypothetical protein